MAKEKKVKMTLTTGKRKTSVARARLKPGSGQIKINGVPLDLYQPDYARMKVREALIIAGDKSKEIEVKVNVKGGGVSSQADAISQSIAKGIVEFFKDEKLKKAYLAYDRNLLVYDDRRCEPHKPSRSRKGARRHKQRSKR
jgi:small subunit ribosomal protein S9